MDAQAIERKDECSGDGDASIENLTPPDSPDADNVFGDPVLSPRVGEKYQVDIPSMITECERLELLANPFDSQSADTSLAFMVGLPVPITWVADNEYNAEARGSGPIKKSKGPPDVNTSSEARNCKKGQSSLRKKSSELSVEHPKAVSRSDNFEGLSFFPVPGLRTYQWNDAEVESFLLGLYIFGKNFIQIRSFMGKTDVGTIQLYYYGKFYRSEAHRRWSRSRKKVRRKKCVIGRKIFTGWRQQELLSRLSSRVSEESQKSLLEGYKSFAEGQTSFEEYIFLLKSTVGVPVLIEVIGIGKGKEDLTDIAMDAGRSNQDIGQQLPTGQDCSSLTSKEIVNLLTGGFRLSKGRCSDIFWDAVWPRLLAKGWHSEQPKNQGYVSSKNYLVFLMPGIKKFSRRKLSKGVHYFDSVSDVLNKVASEPKLIELESEVGDTAEQDGWSPEAGSDQYDRSGSRRHCYLKPRVCSASTSCQMKFTVVDTSLPYEGKSASIRELRYLPAEFKEAFERKNYLVDGEDDSSEDGLDELKRAESQPSQQGDKSRRQKGVSDGGGPILMKFTVVDTSLVFGGKPTKLRDLRCLPLLGNGVSESSGFPRKTAASGDSLKKHHENYAPDTTPKGKRKRSKSKDSNTDMCRKDQTLMKNNSDSALKTDTSMSGDKCEDRTVLHQFRRRTKPGHSDSAVPVVKRRRLTACAKEKTSDISQNSSKSLISSKQAADILKPKKSNTVSEGSRGPEGDIKLKILMRNCSATQTIEGSKNPDRSMDTGITVGRESHKPDGTDKEVVVSEALVASTDVNPTERIATENRRQSTRNRPLTARALEALANGFFNVRRRSRNKGAQSGENPFPKPCRKARSSKAKAGPSHGDAVEASKEDSEVDAVKESLGQVDTDH